MVFCVQFVQRQPKDETESQKPRSWVRKKLFAKITFKKQTGKVSSSYFEWNIEGCEKIQMGKYSWYMIVKCTDR